MSEDMPKEIGVMMKLKSFRSDKLPQTLLAVMNKKAEWIVTQLMKLS